MKKYLPSRPSIISCLVMTGIVTGYYLIDNLSLFSFLGYSTYNLVIKPVYWGLAIFIALRYPRLKTSSKLRQRDNINFRAMLYSVIYVLIWFGAGFVDGFGKSPYDLSFRGILINIITIGSMMVAHELIRNHLVRNLAKKENMTLFLAIALFFTVLSINFSQYAGLKEIKETVIFLAELFLPCFSRNIMVTYLTYIGGSIPSILYMGVLNLVEYLSPILPNLKWITSALTGIMCPIFTMLSLQSKYREKTKHACDKEEEDPIGWLITCTLSIGLIWFVVGVFPVYPSVVATGSMEPIIKPGDVILIKKIGYKEVEAGEVIQFKRDDILVTHRVMEIIESTEGLRFRTKGDNNRSEDVRLVKPEEVKGKVVKVVPKIGWPTLLLKQDKVFQEEIVTD